MCSVIYFSIQIQNVHIDYKITQVLLNFFIPYLLVFTNFNAALPSMDLNMKHKEIPLFTNISGTQKLVKSGSYFPLGSKNIKMQRTEAIKYSEKKPIAKVKEIYEPGHSLSLSHKCLNRGTKLKLLIPILSDPYHYLSRKAIRETWGIFGKRKDVTILFFLGTTTDAYLEIKLAHEQKMFDDIVRCNIYDSYTNLTLKTVSILEWVDRYCFNVNYVLKTDDDVFINMPRLITFVRIRLKLRDVIFGKLSPHTKPHRDEENKYYVSILQYKLQEYPPFVTGPAYLLSGNIVHRLYEESLNSAFLKLEDVFLTGIVAEKLRIKRIDRQEFVNDRISFSVCELQKSISLHSIKYSEQYDLWDKLFNCNPNCPYFCTHKASKGSLVKNNLILFATAILKIVFIY